LGHDRRINPGGERYHAGIVSGVTWFSGQELERTPPRHRLQGFAQGAMIGNYA